MCGRGFAPKMASDTGKKYVALARLSEEAERYEDMVEYMRMVMEMGGGVSSEERNLFSVAYKNVIGARRSSWRVVDSIRKNGSSSRQKVAEEYLDEIGKEVKRIGCEALQLMETQLSKSQQMESKLFYFKMKGDFCRYLAEVATDEQQLYSDASKAAYDKAFELARTQMPLTHPIPLGLNLSYAVFTYEILKEPKKACKMAQETFDAAIADLDSLTEEHYKDSVLILQLLRDNLTQWTEKEAKEQGSGSNGVVEQGSGSNGVVEQGSGSNGIVEQGSGSNGVVEQGSGSNGVVEQGSGSNGVVEQGSGSNGVVEQGSGSNGIVEQGSGSNGVVEQANGVVEQGSGSNGVVEQANGVVEQGSGSNGIDQTKGAGD